MNVLGQKGLSPFGNFVLTFAHNCPNCQCQPQDRKVVIALQLSWQHLGLFFFGSSSKCYSKHLRVSTTWCHLNCLRSQSLSLQSGHWGRPTNCSLRFPQPASKAEAIVPFRGGLLICGLAYRDGINTFFLDQFHLLVQPDTYRLQVCSCLYFVGMFIVAYVDIDLS